MKTHSSFYAWLLVLAMFSGSGAVQADPSNSDEASLGAAAIVVLAQKCAPQQAGYYQNEAHNHLGFMLQKFSESAKTRVFEDWRMKIKALQISSAAESCSSAQRLHSMATHWGYSHILQTMAPPP